MLRGFALWLWLWWALRVDWWQHSGGFVFVGGVVSCGFGVCCWVFALFGGSSCWVIFSVCVCVLMFAVFLAFVLM